MWPLLPQLRFLTEQAKTNSRLRHHKNQTKHAKKTSRTKLTKQKHYTANRRQTKDHTPNRSRQEHIVHTTDHSNNT
jgi:hypothetical protein